MQTTVRVLYFAQMRELTQLKEDQIELLCDSNTTIKDLKDAIVTKHPSSNDLLGCCMFAIDGEYVYD